MNITQIFSVLLVFVVVFVYGFFTSALGLVAESKEKKNNPVRFCMVFLFYTLIASSLVVFLVVKGFRL